VIDNRKVISSVSSPFTQFDARDIRALIAEHPLAWVLTTAADVAGVSQLPLIGDYDEAGRLVSLIGHLSRSNPLAASLTETRRATILFSGPGAYVSPEHAGRRDWAPTWNHAHVKINADIEIDTALTDYSLAVLIDAVEAERTDPWHSDEIADRYAQMRKQIIGFRATVTALEGRFKLGQDERPDTFHAILQSHPDRDLVRWMQRFNAGR
jgi:transcriptional regulator